MPFLRETLKTDLAYSPYSLDSKLQKCHRFEGNRVAHLRTYWKIPCFVPKADAAEGELVTIKRAAFALGVAPSTAMSAAVGFINPPNDLGAGLISPPGCCWERAAGWCLRAHHRSSRYTSREVVLGSVEEA
jgi:hypothetical protein